MFYKSILWPFLPQLRRRAAFMVLEETVGSESGREIHNVGNLSYAHFRTSIGLGYPVSHAIFL